MAVNNNLTLINKLRAEARTADRKRPFIADWEPVERLGHGFFGTVYEIRRGAQRAAVKIIDLTNGNIPPELIIQEIRTLEKIKSNNYAVHIYYYEILTIDHGDYTEQYIAILMELLKSLPETMSESEVLQMAMHTALVLLECHKQTPKIIHCDIKPENILMTFGGDYKLSDFGLARMSMHSHTVGNMGTLCYMSPEMYLTHKFNERTDMYSLGITMYQLLNNGLMPFCQSNKEEEEFQGFSRRLNQEPVPDIPGITAKTMSVVRKLCEYDEKKRYRSAEVLISDIAACIANEAIQRISRASEENNDPENNPEYDKPQSDTDNSVRTQQVEDQQKTTVGSRVHFGIYPQRKNTPEKITWRVLDVTDGKALLISDDLLDVHRFDSSSNDWQSSELREWLNNVFFNKAFSENEQRRMGKIYGDRVTCLSINEVNKFFSNSIMVQNRYNTYPDRMAKPTDYARKNVAFVDSDFGTGWWWLRSPGKSGSGAACVGSDGIIYDIGDSVDYSPYCVRPVIFVSL